MHDAHALAMSHIAYCYVLTNLREMPAQRRGGEQQPATNTGTVADMYMYGYVYACICMHMYNMYTLIHDTMV